MIARDIMTDKVLSVTADVTLQQIAKILTENSISGVPVVDGGNCPVGMVTESDLIALDGNGEREIKREWWLSSLAEGEALSPQFLSSLDNSKRTAQSIMAAPVVTVSETTDLAEVARLLLSYRIKRLPVVQDGRLVGIISRADLVRRMALSPAKLPHAPKPQGVFSAAVASTDTDFKPSQATTPPTVSIKPPSEAITANGFSALVDNFSHQKALEHDGKLVAEAERRKALVKELMDQHIEDANWQEILLHAKEAAEAGQKELLLLRFPCELCSDGGRAINVPELAWPETLRGAAAELYLHWERDLKPQGFHLTAQVLDFPNDIPGDIGLTLVWGGQATASD